MLESFALILIFVVGLALGACIAWLVYRRSRRTQDVEGEFHLSEHARAVIELVPEAVVSMSGKGAILDFNAAAEKLFGHSRDQVIGKMLSSVLIPEDQREAHQIGLRRFLESGKGRILGKKLRLEAKHRSGRRIPVELRASVTRSGGQPVFVGYLRDITKRGRAEDHLRRARSAAEEASRLKSEFLANMSHEIRTPLNAILGYSALLAEPAIDPSKRSDWSRVVRSNGRHLLDLLNGILDLSKIEAGAFEVRREPVDVAQLLRELGRMTAPRAEEKRLDFLISVGADVPESYRGDSLRTRQIMLNLLSNAIKFTDEGSIGIHVRLYEPDGRIHMMVEDTGPGISPEKRSKALEPFTRIHEPGSARKPGTGLGLDVSARLAKLLGGELLVEAGEICGSRFTLSIPNMDGSEERLPAGPLDCGFDWATKSENPEEELRFDGRRILVVEDAPVAQRLLEYHLGNWGADVTCASDGLAATQLILDSPPEAVGFDGVLMDMQMPVLDGYEATRQLREAGFGAPIIGVTADAFEEDRDRCLAAGCDAFLAKPIDAPALRRELSRLIARTEEAEVEPEQDQKSAKELRFAVIYDRYRKSLGTSRSQIEAGLAEGDVDAVRRILHQLKGSAGGYGDTTLSERAGTAEAALRAGSSLDAARDLIDEVIAEMEFPSGESSG